MGWVLKFCTPDTQYDELGSSRRVVPGSCGGTCGEKGGGLSGCNRRDSGAFEDVFSTAR